MPEATDMASKRKSERRDDYLAVRLTDAERKRLQEVVRLFPDHTQAVVVRAALMAGLAVVERDGITIAPKPRR